MKDLSREDQILLITEMIADIWGRYPELRLGQLIINSLPTRYHYIKGPDLFYTTDIDLITALEEFDEAQQRMENDGPKDPD